MDRDEQRGASAIFSDAEIRFLQQHSLGRLATVSGKGMPHVVPVGYAFDGAAFYISTEPQTRKLHNIRSNPRVAFVIDEPPKPRRAVLVQGTVDVVERGPELQQALQVIVAQRGPKWAFREGEQVVLRLTPRHKASWGVEPGSPA